MLDPSFLANFINEEIYLVDETEGQKILDSRPQADCLIITKLPPRKEDLKFLHKIFASVSITPDQLKVQDISQPVLADCSKVFIFGEAGLSLEPYVISEKEGQSLVQGHSLKEIAGNRDKKLKLWEVLQTLFPNPKSP